MFWNTSERQEKPIGSSRQVIGLIPAGGHGKRIAPLPCSKELFPIGFCTAEEGKPVRPKAVCQYLLEKMRLAGVTNVYIVLREGKWDIPTYLGDGSMLDMHFAYLMMGYPFGTSYTVDQAYPFIDDALVAFGFSDILFDPDDAYVHLLKRQTATNADIILGVLPAHNPEMMDMIEMDSDGRVVSLIIKPQRTELRYAWICAVWTPAFTRFQHDFLQTRRVADSNKENDKQEELSVGHVLQAAIHQGLHAEGVIFEHHSYLDIGTPDSLQKAVQDAGVHPQRGTDQTIPRHPRV